MTTPSLHVDTFKQGLLSRLGHDLRLRAARFAFELERGTLRGHVELGSLQVLGAVHEGRVDPGTPSESDKREIEHSMFAEILETSRYREATLDAAVSASGAGRFSVRGTLELHGHREPITASVEQRGAMLRCELELAPSRFGIKPFRALGGALKIQDRVVVTVELPADAVKPGIADLATATARWTEGA